MQMCLGCNGSLKKNNCLQCASGHKFHRKCSGSSTVNKVCPVCNSTALRKCKSTKCRRKTSGGTKRRR